MTRFIIFVDGLIIRLCRLRQINKKSLSWFAKIICKKVCKIKNNLYFCIKEMNQKNNTMKLTELQKAVKAKKTLYNAFGGFYYRSAESILESVKPLLDESVSIYLTDELVPVGAELAIKSTSVYQEGDNVVKASAWAVVDLNKKGMDKAQATGAATSYARKYALGALLLLDDGQDNDAPTEGDIINKIKTTSTTDQLVELFKKLPENQKTTKIKQACSARRKELEK